MGAREEGAVAEYQMRGAGGKNDGEFAEPEVDGYACLFLDCVFWARQCGIDDPLRSYGRPNAMGFAGAVKQWEELRRKGREIRTLSFLKLEGADMCRENGAVDYSAQKGGELVVCGGVGGHLGVEGADNVPGCVVVVEDWLGDGEEPL